MALKVKNPKKNLADILIEKERLNESYDSSSAVSLKTLEETAEEEGTVEQALKLASEADENKKTNKDRPNESIVNDVAETVENTKKELETNQSTQPVSINPEPAAEIQQPQPSQPEKQVQYVQQSLPVPQSQPIQQVQPDQSTVFVQQTQQDITPGQIQSLSQPFMQPSSGTAAQAGIPGLNSLPNQLRKPWEEVEDYNPPRKKRGRPYQGYSENTHVQSIYVRNDLYEYIMINYVGHGRKHSSFNKFVNAAINNYLRQLDENG